MLCTHCQSVVKPSSWITNAQEAQRDTNKIPDIPGGHILLGFHVRTDLITACGRKLFSWAKDSSKLFAFFSPQGYVINGQPHTAASVQLLLDFGTLGVKMIPWKCAGHMEEGCLFEQMCFSFPAIQNSP